MQLPAPPVVSRMDHISPTTYEAALKCKARAAWLIGGDRGALPQHPRALLGIAVHSVLEKARTGAASNGSAAERRSAAEGLFDRAVSQLFGAAHPLLRAKFEVPERLPFYNLYRARAARLAADAPQRPPGHPAGAVRPGVATTMVERRLESRDGRIVGRADAIDAVNATVVDHKTGIASDSGLLADNEARQLRLYAFLAGENEVAIRKGVVERADRTRVEIEISAAEAQAEGRRALVVLEDYNNHVGRRFVDAASPSAENCKHCQCIPFCEAFWSQADAGWTALCGVHIEGDVVRIEGDELISLEMVIKRGSGVRGPAVVTRVSRRWITIGGAALPGTGQVMRITDANQVPGSAAPAVFRADRVATALWRVEQQQDGGDA